MKNRRILLNLYEEGEVYFTSNGVAVIDEAYDIVITAKANDEYKLDFKMPKHNKAYNKLKEGRYIKCDNRIFIIRQIEEYLCGVVMEVNISCEHMMFELLDEFLPVLAKQMSTPQNIINEVLDGTRFTGKTNIGIPVNLQVTKGSRLKCLEELCKNINGIRLCSDLPDKDGKFTIDIIDNTGVELGVLIHNRKNRKSIKRVIDGSQVITRLYPYGAEDLTIQEATGSGGLTYIESENIGKYLRPREAGVVFDSINDATTLLDSARRYLKQHENPIISYEVEMSVLQEMLDLKKPVSIGDKLTVLDEELGENGVSIKAQVTELTYYVDDLNQPLVVSLETVINSADKLIAQMLDVQETDTGIRKGNVWTEFITLPFTNEELIIAFGMEYVTKPVINCHIIGKEPLTPIIEYMTKTNPDDDSVKYLGCTINIPSGTGQEICLMAMGRI